MSADAELLEAVRGKDFSFKGERFAAKVVDVHDGDTCRVVFRFGGRLIQYVARLHGYDSPEIHPLKSKPNRDAEIAAAGAARDALAARTQGLVEIVCGEFDKYGRLLVMMSKDGESVNDWMVANGHGVPYDGGKKAVQF